MAGKNEKGSKPVKPAKKPGGGSARKSGGNELPLGYYLAPKRKKGDRSDDGDTSA